MTVHQSQRPQGSRALTMIFTYYSSKILLYSTAETEFTLNV